MTRMDDERATGRLSRRAFVQAGAAALGAGAIGMPHVARAEIDQITIATLPGLQYLPLFVMESRKLVENAARAAGLGAVSVRYQRLGGPAVMFDGLLSGSAHFGTLGPPPLVQMWARTRDNIGVRTLGAFNSQPFLLNTTNPAVTSIKDFTDKDRIAVPSIKVSLPAVLLQMACAKEWGFAEHARLDRLTVSMSHPDALAAILSGGGSITAHWGAPPYQYLQLRDPRVKTVMSSADVLGGNGSGAFFVTSRRFADQNPRIFQIVNRAFVEASDFVRGNKAEAADIYLAQSKAKEDPALVRSQLENPEIEFTRSPRGLKIFADFLQQTGQVSVKAESWKDFAFAELHDVQGAS